MRLNAVTKIRATALLISLWSLIPGVASADCFSPPAGTLSLIVASCSNTQAGQIVEHLRLYQYGQQASEAEKNRLREQAAELMNRGGYTGVVITAQSQNGSGPYFVPAGSCEDFPAGRSLDAQVGTACCDGDSNPPCYLGFANFLIDDALPRFTPISAGTMSTWLGFQPAVELEHVRHNPNRYSATSSPRLFFSDAYTSHFQTRTQVHVMLYPPGRMFGANRDAMLAGIERQLANSEQNPGVMEGLFIGRERRREGGFTTYAYFGGGPGGESYGAFTELGSRRYELLVQLRTFSEDAIPAEQRPKAWAIPSVELRDVMPGIEAHFLAQMQSQENHERQTVP